MHIQNPKRKIREGLPLFRAQYYKMQTMIFDVSILDANRLILDMILENLIQPWKLMLYLPIKSYEI